MTRIPKYELPVRITLTHEESVLGVIFVRQNQRILDMLCEPKPFFPLRTKTGMFLINKNSVLKLEVLDRDYILDNQHNFPESETKFGFETHAELESRRARNADPDMRAEGTPGGHFR
jgi:hypothetical protein